MSDTTSWSWLAGILAVGLLLVFLLGTAPVEPTASAETQPAEVSQISEGSRTAYAAYGETALIVNAGKDLTLDEWETVRLAGEAFDPSGGSVIAYWTAQDGRGYFDDPHQLRPLYTAPILCGCEECVLLTLTVVDSQGVSTTDQLYIRVRGDPIRCPPVAALGPCVCPPSPCRRPCISPAKPVDRCAPEPLPCEDPCVPHIAPPEPCEPSAVPCVCEPRCSWQDPMSPCDQSPCSSTPGFPWYVDVSTPCPPGVQPTPYINRHYPAAVDEGGAVQLHGRISNPGCHSACFMWTADKGSFDDATSLNPIWYAPMSDRCGGEKACITLSIIGDCDGRGYDQIRIHVNNTDYWRRDPG